MLNKTTNVLSEQFKNKVKMGQGIESEYEKNVQENNDINNRIITMKREAEKKVIDNKREQQR